MKLIQVRAQPIKMVPCRVPLHIQQEVADHTTEMQERGIIQVPVPGLHRLFRSEERMVGCGFVRLS